MAIRLEDASSQHLDGDREVQGTLLEAIQEVAAAIAPLETAWDVARLEKKLQEYFHKAGRHLEFRGRSLPLLVNEYADSVMASIFTGLGDREWLYNGQADFLLCLDAGVRDNLPAYMMRGVRQPDFEQLVLAAYDRAFDEQRFYPLLCEAVPQITSGPKMKKKVWHAVDAGRKDAVASGIAEADEFVSQWIHSTVAHLATVTQGSPDDCLSRELCAKLFALLLEGRALPLALGGATLQHPVEEIVSDAYAEHTVWHTWACGAPAKRMRSGAG